MLRIALLIALLFIPAFTIAEGPEGTTPPPADPAKAPAAAEPNGPKPAKSTQTKSAALLAQRKKETSKKVRDSFRPPALKMESLNDELKRAATEHKLQSDRLAKERIKIEQERAALYAERTELEALLKKIEEAQANLKNETGHLEETLEKNGAELAELKKARKINAQQLRAMAESECTKGKKDDGDEFALGAGAEGAGGGRIQSLSKAIRNMKPKQAALLLKSLDRDISVALLRRMPARQAGAVLSAMKPAAAAILATDLATDPDTGEVLP